MGKIAGILNNTILIPCHDGAASGSAPKLPDTKDLTNAVSGPILSNVFTVKVLGSSSGGGEELTYCQAVKGLSVSRGADSVVSDKMYYLPKAVTYGEVTLLHIRTISTAFLDWLFNSADRGGSSPMDIEITPGDKAGSEKDRLITYTLRNAIPTKYEISGVNRLDALYYNLGKFALERVSVAYNRLDVSVMKR